MNRILQSPEDFITSVGSELGTSEWLLINQKMIDSFADATLDHQWIHIDSKRASTESPFHKTIAHGYLTLSLIPHFLEQIISDKKIEKIVNYGIEKMTFKDVIPVDSKLRMCAILKNAKDLGNICLSTIQCIFEIEGKDKPVAEGLIKYLYYFKNN